MATRSYHINMRSFLRSFFLSFLFVLNKRAIVRLNIPFGRSNQISIEDMIEQGICNRAILYGEYC